MSGQEGATRPSLPPVAWLASGLWSGIAFAEARFAESGGGVSAWLLLLGAVLAVAVAVRWQRAGVAFAVAGAVAGCVLAGASLAHWRSSVEALVASGSSDLRVTVVADARETQWGWTVATRPDAPEFGGYIVDLLGDEERPPEQGSVHVLRGRVEPVALDDPWAQRCWRAGNVGRISPWGSERAGWQSGALGVLRRHRSGLSRRIAERPGAGSDLLRGMLLGDRRGLTGGDVEEDFRVSGMSHLLAVSGLHLGLVALGFGRTLRALRASRPLQAFGVVAGGVAFAALTGFQPSTTRALAMVVVAWLAALSGRRGDGIAGLSVAVCCMLVWQPMAAFSISLQLSVAAVGGLLVLGALVGDWLEALVPVGWIAKGLAATVVAQATTLPVVANVFHVISLVAPAANVIAIPLASAGLAAGVAGALVELAVPPVGALLMGVASRLLEVTASVARVTAAIPHASVPVEALGPLALVTWIFAVVASWALWPQPAKRAHAAAVVALALAATSAFAVLSPGHTRLVVANVGQADAIVLQDGGETMLVDCGSHPGDVAEALARLHVRHIDALVLTHAHDDHTGGLDALVGAVTVGWVGIPATRDPDQIAIDPARAARLTPRGRVPVRRLRAGEHWRIGDTLVTVLWPKRAQSDAPTNDTSVVLLLSRGGFAALLGGDAEEGVWDALAQDGSLPDVDVLKVAHHGSSNGYSEDALDALRPEIALLSVGEGNSFGHPSPETCAALQARNTAIRRTDLEGDLIVTLDPVPTCTGAGLEP